MKHFIIILLILLNFTFAFSKAKLESKIFDYSRPSDLVEAVDFYIAMVNRRHLDLEWAILHKLITVPSRSGYIAVIVIYPIEVTVEY